MRNTDIQQLLEMLNPNSPYQQALMKAQAEVPEAVARLKSTGRGGCRALADFKRLLANGGDGLDNRNWAALADLIHGGLTRDECELKLKATLYRSDRGRRAFKALAALIERADDCYPNIRSALETLCRAEGQGLEDMNS